MFNVIGMGYVPCHRIVNGVQTTQRMLSSLQAPAAVGLSLVQSAVGQGPRQHEQQLQQYPARVRAVRRAHGMGVGVLGGLGTFLFFV